MQEKIDRDKIPFRKIGIKSVKEFNTPKLENAPKFGVLEDEELRGFVGQPRTAVVYYIARTYLERIPGQAHLEYLLNYPEKAPLALKDGHRYYFMGCLDEDVGISYIIWSRGQGKFVQSSGKSKSVWITGERVLLLDR